MIDYHFSVNSLNPAQLLGAFPPSSLMTYNKVLEGPSLWSGM